MRMDIVSDQGMFLLPHSIIKQKACESALQAILIGPAKWEPMRWTKPTQHRVEVGVLV